MDGKRQFPALKGQRISLEMINNTPFPPVKCSAWLKWMNRSSFRWKKNQPFFKFFCMYIFQSRPLSFYRNLDVYIWDSKWDWCENQHSFFKKEKRWRVLNWQATPRALFTPATLMPPPPDLTTCDDSWRSGRLNGIWLKSVDGRHCLSHTHKHANAPPKAAVGVRKRGGFKGRRGG